jgi:hypothetical protein
VQTLAHRQAAVWWQNSGSPRAHPWRNPTKRARSKASAFISYQTWEKSEANASPTAGVLATLAQGLLDVILNFGTTFESKYLVHNFSVAANIERCR